MFKLYHLPSKKARGVRYGELRSHCPQLWSEARRLLKLEIPEYGGWIKPLKGSWTDKELILIGPKAFFVKWVRTKYFTFIEQVLIQLSEFIWKLENKEA